MYVAGGHRCSGGRSLEGSMTLYNMYVADGHRGRVDSVAVEVGKLLDSVTVDIMFR